MVKAVCPQLHCSDTFVLIVRMIVNGHHARHFVVQYLLDNVRTDLEFVQPGSERAPQIVWRESTLMLCFLIVLANFVEIEALLLEEIPPEIEEVPVRHCRDTSVSCETL